MFMDLKLLYCVGYLIGIADEVLGSPLLKRHREDLGGVNEN